MVLANRPAIECEGLRRVYNAKGFFGRTRETVALDGISFAVEPGTVFGLLGPNGAGKTTTIRILTTLLTPTNGQARVLGSDVVREARTVRRHISFIFGGDRGLYGRLTGRENLRYFAALHQMRPTEAQHRTSELLELVGLAGREDSLVEEYSRGMKQRLHLARGLLSDPDVLFLDEPTIGLDPVAARDLRRLVPELAQRGKTVLLTTHYMFEADVLCDRIAIINRGKLVATGAPADIKRSLGGASVVEVVLRQPPGDLLAAVSSLAGVEYVESGSDGAYPKLTILTTDGRAVEARIRALVPSDGIERTGLREPTLEEAYLKLVK